MNGVGLLGWTMGAIIEDVGLANVNITGSSDVGGLVGYTYGGTVDNNYVSGGSVSGSSSVGGLVGKSSSSSSIENSYVIGIGSVSGSGKNVGGFIGSSAGSSMISNSYATITGNVSSGSGSNVGGFVGADTSIVSDSISNSYATVTGNVSGSSSIGGFVGFDWGGISNSYAVVTGNVSGSSSVGGFVGSDGAFFGPITNCSYYGTAADSYVTNKANAASDFFSTAYPSGKTSGGNQVYWNGGIVGGTLASIYYYSFVVFYRILS